MGTAARILKGCDHCSARSPDSVGCITGPGKPRGRICHGGMLVIPADKGARNKGFQRLGELAREQLST
jgi:hypothetical protein